MKKALITFGLVITFAIAAGFGYLANAEESGVTTVKVESEVVSIPSGQTVTATSSCPGTKTLIGGGGVCLGFMGTENKVVLTISAPSPDAKNSWFVVCSNMNNNPGEAQAMSWAMCADPEALVPEKKK